jgi:hypothetical protein
VRDKSASDDNFLCRAARLNAERGRRKPDDDPFDQRVARASVGLDTSTHINLANRLADLDTNRAVGMRDDALEIGRLHCAGVDIEAPRSFAEGLDWRLHLNEIDASEVDKSDRARAIGSYRLVRDPSVDLAPHIRWC